MTENTLPENTLPEGYVRLTKAAAYVDFHPDTLRKRAKDGLVTYYKLGKRGDLRFRVADLDELLDREDKSRKNRSAENGGPHSHGEER